MFLRRFQRLAYTDLHQCIPHRGRDIDTIALPGSKETFEVLKLFFRVHQLWFLPLAMNRHLGGGIGRDLSRSISAVQLDTVSRQRVLGREQLALRSTSLAKRRVTVWDRVRSPVSGIAVRPLLTVYVAARIDIAFIWYVHG